jgi:AraC-like DNA-binding protein
MSAANRESVRPLDRFPAFAVSNFDRLSGILEAQLGAKFARLPVCGDNIDAVANSALLTHSQLWYCSYGMPLSVKFPDGDYIRLQVQHQGTGGTWERGHLTGVTPYQACISRAEVEIDFASDFEQLVWRIPKGILEQRLALLTGRPVGYALDFVPALDLTSPQGMALKQLFDCLIRAVELEANPSSALVVKELEQALISAFLATCEHSGRPLLEGTTRRAGSRQIRRVEAHIEANWDKPITIEGLVEVSGTSARSLFRSFKESRGCTPMEFARRLRLQHARQMLALPQSGTTVTAVAFTCGFGDAGHFAREFQRTFGERPSDVLARGRSQLGVA